MDPEDREFRRNQTDIEIYLKITLGCITIMGAGTIALGVYLPVHSLDYFALILIALVLSMAVCAVYGVGQSNKFRKRLNEPKEPTYKLQDELMPTTKAK